MSAILDLLKEEVPAGGDRLEELEKCATLEKNLAEVIGEIEEHLKNLHTKRNKLITERMPDLMAQVQITVLEHKGRKYSLDKFVGGSFPKDPDRSQRAIEWLEDHDSAGLLKTTITATFGRDSYEDAQALYDEMAKVCTPVLQSTVHPSTLKSWAKKRLENGEPLNMDLLGIHSGNIVKVKELKQ